MTAKSTVVFDAGAQDDLAAIADYLFTVGGEDAANAFVTTIAARVATLSEFPLRGSIPRELDNDDSFRQVVSGRYRIIYEMEERRVTVVLIADGRRDMQALLRARLLRPAADTPA